MPTTYWLTRDDDPTTGKPIGVVDVWGLVPERVTTGRGSIWIGGQLIGCFTIGAARAEKMTVPDDSRQLIRVGR